MPVCLLQGEEEIRVFKRHGFEMANWVDIDPLRPERSDGHVQLRIGVYADLAPGT